jgi:hypothetical protein
VTFDLRQHHLAHLGQHLLVRPRGLPDEMQQRLMLAAVRSGAVIAAIGSTLLRSHGIIRPIQ